MSMRQGNGSAPAQVQILIVDPEWLFRESVAWVLEQEPPFEVVARVDTLVEAEMHAERAQPAVAIVSAKLVDGDGIEAMRRIIEMAPDCRVVLLADGESPRVLRQAVEAGASGYLTKEAELSELIGAVWALTRGEVVIPPHLLGDLLRDLTQRRQEFDEHRQRLARLTGREREVLALLSKGGTSKSIGDSLGISSETARTHAHNLLRKMGMHSRLEAASYVLQHDLLDELSTPHP